MCVCVCVCVCVYVKDRGREGGGGGGGRRGGRDVYVGYKGKVCHSENEGSSYSVCTVDLAVNSVPTLFGCLSLCIHFRDKIPSGSIPVFPLTTVEERFNFFRVYAIALDSLFNGM